MVSVLLNNTVRRMRVSTYNLGQLSRLVFFTLFFLQKMKIQTEQGKKVCKVTAVRWRVCVCILSQLSKKYFYNYENYTIQVDMTNWKISRNSIESESESSTSTSKLAQQHLSLCNVRRKIQVPLPPYKQAIIENKAHDTCISLQNQISQLLQCYKMFAKALNILSQCVHLNGFSAFLNLNWQGFYVFSYYCSCPSF